jgi:hypothetical protein
VMCVGGGIPGVGGAVGQQQEVFCCDASQGCWQHALDLFIGATVCAEGGPSPRIGAWLWHHEDPA